MIYISGDRDDRYRIMIRLLALFSILAAFTTQSVPAARAAGVLVFAASSTTNAVEEIDADYRTTQGGSARAAFGSSGMLARQIEGGAPADILISANPNWIDYLVGKRLIDPRDMRTLMTNSLVLVAPAGSAVSLVVKPGFPLLQALGDGRLAIADPATTPAGAYAKAALTSLGVWDKVSHRTALGRNVREALALVEHGGAPLGIVYATDAAISRSVKVVATFHAGLHPPIQYVAAPIAARKTPATKRYFDFLTSVAAAKIFRKHGFSPITRD